MFTVTAGAWSFGVSSQSALYLEMALATDELKRYYRHNAAKTKAKA